METFYELIPSVTKWLGQNVPSAAKCDATIWLSAPRYQSVAHGLGFGVHAQMSGTLAYSHPVIVGGGVLNILATLAKYFQAFVRRTFCDANN